VSSPKKRYASTVICNEAHRMVASYFGGDPHHAR